MTTISLQGPFLPAVTSRMAPPVPESLQKIWLAIAHKAWSSLAVVPADAGAAEDAGMLAEALLDTAAEHGARTLQLLDGTRAGLRDHVRFATAVRLCRDANGLLMSVGPLKGAPTGLALARATSAVIVVARLGSSTLADIRYVSDVLGPDRVIGCVVVQ